MEIVKWWKNKWALLLIAVGISIVVVGFLFTYFISWGWILALVVAAVGGFTIRRIAKKMVEQNKK